MNHVIIGPTGIGKSAFAIDLAKKTGLPIVSADAFQVYRGMDVGTGKVSIEIRAEVPHYLIDIKNPDEPYSAGEFNAQTNAIIQERGPVIICGGTGMYVYAFLHGFEFSQAKADPEFRQDYANKLAQNGPGPLWEALRKIDPECAQMIDPHNGARIIRALEIYHTTHALPSELRRRQPSMRQDVNIIGLTASRDIMYERINRRVDTMVESGWIEEVKALRAHYSREAHGFQALGYRQIMDYLDNRIGHTEMLESIKTKTRQFAKRQLTWYRRFDNVNWHTIL